MNKSSIIPQALAAAFGIALDRLVGEPTTRLHPLVLFGRVMETVEARLYRDSRSAGVAYSLIGSGAGAVFGSALRSTLIATELAVGGQALLQAADNIATALTVGAIDQARELLPTLVGRDPTNLDANEIARATVESVAENTVDAVVAPAFWAATCGAQGALAYRAVNTMDAMVGYRSSRYTNYGWASARLDDAANWLPARLTAGLVVLVRPHKTRAIYRAVGGQAPAHPSPNAGVAEAAFAAALGLRLGGTNRYGPRLEVRPTLGTGRPPAPYDIQRAIALSRDVATLLMIILGCIGGRQWKKNLEHDPPPGAHGGDGALIAKALGLAPQAVLDLSQSLNPIAPDPTPVVVAHLDALGRYPDPGPAKLALAAAMDVDPHRLLLTNGGSEAIALVTRLIGGSVKEPEFALHPRGKGPLWRSNPHSPSGLLAKPNERAAVWDEAFYPLATGRWTRGDEASTVVGSLTKLLACPGLRIGYVLSDIEMINACRRLQPLWSVNGLATACLLDLLAPIDLSHTSAALRDLRTSLVELLERYGLRVLPSDANWVLVERPGLRDALAHELVAVRDCTSFGLPGVARVSVPNADGLARLGAALDQLGDWLEKSDGSVPSPATNERGPRT